MNFFQATLLLFSTHLKRILFSRRMAFCLLVAMGPAALVTLIRQFDDGPETIEMFIFPGWVLMMQLVLPILSLVAGSAVISEEIEDRTVTYLFTRPIPRASLLLARWLATALLLGIILAAGVLLHAFAASFGHYSSGEGVPLDVVLPLLVTVVLGGMVYSALFAVLGTFHKHPMILGLAYSFAIEGFLANLPGKSQGLTIQFYLRSHLIGRGSEVWQRVSELKPALYDPPGEALMTLIAILVVTLVIGSITISRKQYILTA